MCLKYIGPFLRINKLKKENVEHQLFHLAKESLKQVVLYSKCGVHTSPKELKIKNTSNFDINTFKDVSPLLCIYKKASPKLINIENILCWDEDKFKKEINIDSNALMTLCLLELCDYYSTFKNIDTKNYNLANLYFSLSKKQLEFYASYFRNEEGVFVDKKDSSDLFTGELKFEEKNKKFKFSTQALLMAAYYKCACLCKDEDNNGYKNFSLDILNMFINYKEELYLLSSSELTELCLGLNIFYKYSKNEDCKVLLLDLSELLYEKYSDCFVEFDLEKDCMNYINFTIFYKNTGIVKFKDKAEDMCSKFLELYDPEKGIFIKDTESKDINFSCLEIALYVLVCITHSQINQDSDKSDLIILDVFKHQLVDSGIIASWPDVPDLQDVERYKNYTLKSEDLLDDQDFRMTSIPTPESCELASVFNKSIVYNKKKETFKVSKNSFDTYKNMLIFFLIINLLKPKRLVHKIVEENMEF